MSYIELESKQIPRITIGTSPFMGAGQFGVIGSVWRAEFFQNAEKMAQLMIHACNQGAKGVEVIPAGAMLDAAVLAKKRCPDFAIIGSTLWEHIGNYFHIDDLVKVDSRIIFLHGSISDNRELTLIKPLLKKIRLAGKIPGIATHYPAVTIPFIHQNKLDCPAILLPFNLRGAFMGDQRAVEELVDSLDYCFVAMKSLAAGQIPPTKAFPYLGEHNISAVTVGMVSEEEITQTVSEAKKVFF
ncbi:MAG: hypothetical protein EU536_02560 [Promethearchaeota archaeon]|nr:MAG: hypothetical protein EU536_02560 [Candidatus Lokiarchaeota archaeon]